MTKLEYNQAIEAIDVKYREDRAALERVWILLNGSKAPDGVIEVNGSERVHLMNGADLPGVVTGGSPSSAFGREGTERRSLKGLSPDEKKARKAAYMKAYMARRKSKT